MPEPPLTAGELQAILVVVRRHYTACRPGTLPRLVLRLQRLRDEAERNMPGEG